MTYLRLSAAYAVSESLNSIAIANVTRTLRTHATSRLSTLRSISRNQSSTVTAPISL